MACLAHGRVSETPGPVGCTQACNLQTMNEKTISNVDESPLWWQNEPEATSDVDMMFAFGSSIGER